MKLGLLTAVLLAVTALTIGCSDSETLTLEEYFVEFEAIDAEIDAEIEALYVDFPDESGQELLSDDANVLLLQDLVAGFAVAIGNSVERLKALDPPSEVEDEHNALIDAGEDATVAFEEGSEVIEDVETIDALETVFPEVEANVDATQAAFEAACLDVVAVGEANGITVTVTCVDE